ncbi:MAG TPA: ornithine cyclodeaminase family protein [Methanoregulaceae archaeon]|nr:ornithine cyclodeaminase family protein [Methanoregulaceae archaeon]
MQYYARPETGLDPSCVNEAVEAAFAAFARGETEMPPKVYVTLPGGDFRTMPAYIPALGLAGVKIVNVHPGNPARGLETVMALIVLLDPPTGMPYAILNATGLTDLRTGAAGAVAARHLCRKQDGIELGLIGAGRQAETQLEATSAWLGIDRVRVWSRRSATAEAFARRFSRFEIRADSLERTADCDLLVTTTPSREPLVMDAWIRDGTHINAIGADAPGKQELDPAILIRASVYVDDPRQAIHSGEINVPIAAGGYSIDRIAGTLGDVVIGRGGRHSDDEVTVFDSTGLAVQDLAIAGVALRRGGPGVELVFP